ncbi:MAG: T9SS type A sorting domain-containing protein [Chlorobiota bacterium]
MKDVLRGFAAVVVLLVWAERGVGQVPFTARAGLEVAQRAAGVSIPPSALGTVGDGSGLRKGGKAMSWVYGFRPEAGRVIWVVVTQETPGQFTARLIPTVDIVDLLAHADADPLPSDFFDSDSAMAIVRRDSVYQEWMSSESIGEEKLLAGWLPLYCGRRGCVRLVHMPAWVYNVINRERTWELYCWRSVFGGDTECMMMPIEQNSCFFSAREGLGFAQYVARTTSQPCLVMAAVADTNGLGREWIYVFPSGDTVRAAAVIGNSVPGSFQGMEVSVESTIRGEIPVYVRAAPFAAGWINSTTALERMRQTAEYRQWRASLTSDKVSIQMYGGRSRPTPGSSVPPGTAVWIWVGRGWGPNLTIACVCNLEDTAPFVQCSYVSSVSSPAQPGVMLAPNPASDVAVVQLGEECPIESIVVHDVQGRAHEVPYISSGATAWLEVQGLVAGTYIVTVHSGLRQYRHLLQVVR